MKDIQCAKCPYDRKLRICNNPDGKYPPFCATVNGSEAIEEAKQIYLQEDTHTFALEAARQEGTASAVVNGASRQVKPRIVETVELCKRMGYHHIGLAFCGGLIKEARVVNKILETNGFKVTSVMCKAGCVDKGYLGITDAEKKKGPGHESMCNNITQALVMNMAETEFNIVLGLCVGHDSLFMQYSNAPCTVLAAKDRVTGNNPLQPIYLYDSYFDYLKKPL